MRKIGQRLLIGLTLCLSSCATSWLPKFYVGDYKNEQIINSDNQFIKANDPLFNFYGCLHSDDIISLKQYLNSCKCPSYYQYRIDQAFSLIYDDYLLH